MLLLLGMASAQPMSRQEHLSTLTRAGFRVSPSLPVRQMRPLRQSAEIVQRMLALHTLCLWVDAPPEKWSDAQILSYLETRKLRSALTADERAILKLTRSEARARFLDQIGWRLENLWALAWIAGFDLKPDLRGQFSGAELRRLVYDWLPGPSPASQTAFEKNLKLRLARDVAELEDLLYCAHKCGAQRPIRSFQCAARLRSGGRGRLHS